MRRSRGTGTVWKEGPVWSFRLGTGKERTYERCMFSLTSEVSKEIDRLSLVPRDFRASRSDVVKAAIAAFAALPEAEQVKQLIEVK